METTNLYTTLWTVLATLPWTDIRHLATFSWMLVGLLMEQTVNLDAWSSQVVSRTECAASTVCRFRRWLNHPAIHVHDLYAPLIQPALSAWGAPELWIALDTSVLWNEFCIVRVALLYRGRAIPLVWQVLAHSSSSVAYAVYAPLLDQVAALLPRDVRVIFSADRGFADIALMRHCQRWGWRWRIRIKGSFTLYRRGRHYAVAQLRGARGQACGLDHVHLTADYYGPIYLAVAWPLGTADPWYVASNDPATLATLQEYGQRFAIEENFLDDKSNGFQLADSRLRDAAVLTRLGLVLAVATLFLVAQGVVVEQTGQRRRVDPHWVHKALGCVGHSLTQWHLPGGPDPAPAQASRQQHAARQLAPLTVISPTAVEPE